jgi:hypothetical protein
MYSPAAKENCAAEEVSPEAVVATHRKTMGGQAQQPQSSYPLSEQSARMSKALDLNGHSSHSEPGA